ncbi:MAG: bifunctional metallophosphatase/5'-nucleotidase [Calditrichia bacterium]
MKHTTKFLIILMIVLIVQSFYSGFSQDNQSGETKELIIVETSDVHGAIFPYDFLTDRVVDQGYLAAAYIIDSLRQRYGKENVLYVDCGDLLQGDPLANYYNTIDTITTHPLIQVLNDMQCDVFVVGNHDIEQGKAVWKRARRFSEFPWLAANVVDEKDSSALIFSPTAILNKNGLKIGVVGLTTPGIPMWLPENIWKGMRFEDMVQTIPEYIKLKDSVDILIGAFHSGITPQKFTTGYPQDVPEENASGMIAKMFPAFSVILTGHEHKKIPANPVTVPLDSPLIVMPGSKAHFVAFVKIKYRQDKEGINILSREAQLIPVRADKLKKELSQKYADIHQMVLNYVNIPIGTINGRLSAEKSRYQDTPFMDLIHTVQLEVTNADVSLAACFDDRVVVPAGQINRKSTYSIYKYENSLYTVRMKLKDLLDHLAKSAEYFQLKDKQLAVNKKIPGYNFDMAEGLSYDLIYSEEGPEVLLRKADPHYGSSGEEYITVAVNSYRAQQLNKNYDMEIIWKSEKTIRDYIEEYIRKNSPINPQANNNWSIKIK